MKIIQKPSRNFDTRRGDQKPSLLILHYTGMKTASQAIERLCDSNAQVSAHYTVDEDGAVYQHVEEANRAWHAGASFWRGETDINSASIGIELVNPGHEFGYRPFPEAQINNLIKLCKPVMERYGIVAEGVLAHSDVAPSRKEDPGELFPWARLAAQGIGVWPEAAAEAEAVSDDREALIQYGYDPNCDDKTVITAFQRHFVPDVFENGEPGKADVLTRQRLHFLMSL